MAFYSATTIRTSEKEASGKFAIDSLFEKSRQKNIHQLHLYNVILERVHKRITIAARMRLQQLVFRVPLFILSEPHYQIGECMSHITQRLETDGFVVQYSAPNNLIIHWSHWIPDYVRQEYFKQTGNKIDGKGCITVTPINDDPPTAPAKPTKEYLSTTKNRPTGLYPAEYFDKIRRAAGGPTI
jgi:hypothetical protein